MYLTTLLFVVYAVALSVMPSVIATPLISSLHITPVQLGFLSSVYFYPYMLMQVPGGLLLDRWGARKVVTVALLLCSSGALIFAVANNFWEVCLSRLILGAGSCTAFVSLLLVSRIQFKGRYFAFFSGAAIVAAAIGAVGGQIVVAYFLEFISWRSCLSYLSFAGFILAISHWFAASQLPHEYIKSQTKLFNNLKTLLSNPQIRCIALFAFLNAVPLGSFADLWGVPYFQKAYSIDAKAAAILCGMIWLGLAVSSPIIGFIADKINNQRLVLIVLSVLSLLGTCAALQPHLISLDWMKVIMFFLGIACSGQAITFTLIMKNTPTRMAATASGINNMAVVATPLFFQIFVGAMMNFRGIHADITLYTLNDYLFSLAILPMMSVMALVVGYKLIREPKPEEDIMLEASVFANAI
jgi:MFS family permease